ncbi:DUF3299 domain-containing protein [Reinekea marinisedimentorum]|uniref:DUF3299 domain-containing protein n=1 Tax=Reinekea marinisedimentorum TaxID=230495 RepID=A0A4R3I511_9GAMM|nr:DUF3299 domain-containing protein [Reinekea marinisedimentorum]TCS41042.1 hypothetical protein BCF53_10756 [Reinekea marinisedimentorum]
MRKIALLNYLLAAFVCLSVNTVVAAEPNYQELTWDDLMPLDFDPNTMYNELDFSSYNIENMTDDDPETQRLYADLMDINRRAPMVDTLEGVYAKLPGFIVPLEMDGDKVTSFFLVPYFGACIHTPPPSPNQMVYVETQGIKLKSIDEPVWVRGRMLVETVDNEVGMAGYTMYTNLVDSYYD